MAERKSLQELTIKDNFMFGAVMLDPEICKELLERILEIPIDRVEVDIEKSIVYHPEYKGVRLDVYAQDEKNTHYNVEMQVKVKDVLEKRSRYYHSQIDVGILEQGTDYEELPDSYVIFICDFDPFKQKKYRYTFEKTCKEIPRLQMNDGSYTIFLSTKGTNKDEVSPELIRFLEYVESPKDEEISDDLFIEKLKKSVKKVKADREMGASYMTLEEMLRDEFRDGLQQGLEQGMEQGLEQGIKFLVEGYCEMGAAKEAVVKTLIEKMDIPQVKAEAYVEKYWLN